MKMEAPGKTKGGTKSQEECKDVAQSPRECPPPAKMCEYINDYMCWWKEWADAVHAEVFPQGDPDDPDPPPWPPFTGGS